MGTGTTGVSALGNNRQFIGIDISPDYVAIAEKRLRELTSAEQIPGSEKKKEINENGGSGLDKYIT
jgi:DNA modification methylase